MPLHTVVPDEDFMIAIWHQVKLGSKVHGCLSGSIYYDKSEQQIFHKRGICVDDFIFYR